jgi:hypothetical protein
MSRSTAVKDMYRTVLTARFGLTVQDDGSDLTFEFDGWTFHLLNPTERDPDYLSIVLGFAGTEGVGEDPLAAANEVNGVTKLVRAVVTPAGVLFVADLVLAGPGCVPDAGQAVAVIPRCLSALEYAAGRFRDEQRLRGIQRASEDHG